MHQNFNNNNTAIKSFILLTHVLSKIDSYLCYTMKPSRQTTLRLRQYLRQQSPDHTTLNEIIELHGNHTGAGLLLLASLLSMIPLLGLGNILSILILSIAWKSTEQSQPYLLPSKLSSIKISSTWTRRVLSLLTWVYRQAMRRLQERCVWASSPSFQIMWSIWITVMVGIMLLPLPLGNFLPSLSLFFISLGWVFKDGLMLVLSLCSGFFAIAYAVVCWHWVTKAIQTFILPYISS